MVEFDFNSALTFLKNVGGIFISLWKIVESIYGIFKTIFMQLAPLFSLVSIFYEGFLWLLKNVVNMIAFFGSLLMMFIQNINAYILAFTDLINKGLDYINMGLNIFQKVASYFFENEYAQ